MKEIEDPVVDTLQARPEFVDTISQEIRFRTAEFVAKLTEPLQSQKAFILCFLRQLLEPVQDRA